MQKPSCSREGCTTPARSLGLCPAHYHMQHRETMRTGRRPRPDRLSGREAHLLAELRSNTGQLPVRELRRALVERRGNRIAAASVSLVADYLVARGLAMRIQAWPGAERQYQVTEAGREFSQARIDEALA